MEGDLISRKEAEKILRAYADDVGCNRGEYVLANGILKAVTRITDPDIVPAAYDVGKVLEQLEILLEKETTLICRHVSDASYMAAIIGHTMLVDAVEIVKLGGINTNGG